MISKQISGKTYYYLATSARVDGKPRIVDQRYLGTAAEIEAAMDGASQMPSRTRHLAFGDLAADWRVIDKLGVVEIVGEVLVFIQDHLPPEVDPKDEHLLGETQELIREEAKRIKGLVAARLARIDPELAARAGVVVHCPDCRHSALSIEHGDLRCRFCDRTFEPDDAASEYADTVLGLGFRNGPV